MTTKECLNDAILRFSTQVHSSNCQVFSWFQTWEDTSCGFGVIGGCAITKAKCVVVYAIDIKQACVYHNGRFAYMIKKTGDEFNTQLEKRNMPGLSEFKNAKKTTNASY